MPNSCEAESVRLRTAFILRQIQADLQVLVKLGNRSPSASHLRIVKLPPVKTQEGC